MSHVVVLFAEFQKLNCPITIWFGIGRSKQEVMWKENAIRSI